MDNELLTYGRDESWGLGIYGDGQQFAYDDMKNGYERLENTYASADFQAGYNAEWDRLEKLKETLTMIDVSDLPITAEAYRESQYSHDPLQFIVKEMGKLEKRCNAITPESLASALWEVPQLRHGHFTQSQFRELVEATLREAMGGEQ